MEKKRNYQTPKLNAVKLESESIIMAASGGASFSLHGQLHGTGTRGGNW